MSDIKSEQTGTDEEVTSPDALSVEDLDNVAGGNFRAEAVHADALKAHTEIFKR